jgi:aquaporin Z
MDKEDATPPVMPWQVFVSELVGTMLLLLVGLSLVILMFGEGSPMKNILPSEDARRLITGFLFGGWGGLIALSPIGERSGAHINPIVTLAFRLAGRIELPTALGYIGAQLVGAIVGCLPLLAWGAMGRSMAFGATAPGPGYTIGAVLLGEVITTFTMVTLLFVFLAFRRTRSFTPALFPFLYSIMVYLESPISGTSTNPARSLGPAVISGQWDGWWIYWVGPIIGSVAACLACSFLAKRIEVAKLYHFESDRDRLFRRRPSTPALPGGVTQAENP